MRVCLFLGESGSANRCCSGGGFLSRRGIILFWLRPTTSWTNLGTFGCALAARNTRWPALQCLCFLNFLGFFGRRFRIGFGICPPLYGRRAKQKPHGRCSQTGNLDTCRRTDPLGFAYCCQKIGGQADGLVKEIYSKYFDDELEYVGVLHKFVWSVQRKYRLSEVIQRLPVPPGVGAADWAI